MSRLKMWGGQLRVIPKHAAYQDAATVVAAMQKKYGPNVPQCPPSGYGRQLQRKRAKRTFPRLDKLVSPPVGVAEGHYRGLKVYARDSATVYGRANGTTFRCPQEGCTGHRLVVIWPDGQMTFPCGKGLVEFKDGWRIT